MPTVRNHPSPSQRAGQSLPPALANVLEQLRDAAASHDGEYPGGFLPAAGSSAEAVRISQPVPGDLGPRDGLRAASERAWVARDEHV